MCGADLAPKENEKVCECEFCGTKQTISSSSDEKVLKTISRGSLLRNKCEFDKARTLYEQLITENLADAEVYWNIILCKYGITYVDDYDGTKKPTINRMSSILITDDDDFKKCIELADVVTREQYKTEANQIASIQKEILEIVNKEEPYDIFISYKETDEFGERTRDSLRAYEIYEALTKEGYRVFLSRVVLSSVAGQNYEPYIYSALYSAKAMILITSQEEYANAVWVKNEWSRFLSLMKKDKNKILIPCYFDMDPYDLPKEIRNIQALDMSKLGFIQDLMLGVNKIFGKTFNANNVTKQSPYIAEIDGKIKRCYILLEDKNFNKISELIDDILNIDPENGEAYFILSLVDLKLSYDEFLKNPFQILDNRNFAKFQKYGSSEKVKSVLDTINSFYTEHYLVDIEKLDSMSLDNLFLKAKMLKSLNGYNNSYEQYLNLLEAINKKGGNPRDVFERYRCGKETWNMLKLTYEFFASDSNNKETKIILKQIQDILKKEKEFFKPRKIKLKRTENVYDVMIYSITFDNDAVISEFSSSNVKWSKRESTNINKKMIFSIDKALNIIVASLFGIPFWYIDTDSNSQKFLIECLAEYRDRFSFFNPTKMLSDFSNDELINELSNYKDYVCSTEDPFFVGDSFNPADAIKRIEEFNKGNTNNNKINISYFKKMIENRAEAMPIIKRNDPDAIPTNNVKKASSNAFLDIERNRKYHLIGLIATIIALIGSICIFTIKIKDVGGNREDGLPDINRGLMFGNVFLLSASIVCSVYYFATFRNGKDTIGMVTGISTILGVINSIYFIQVVNMLININFIKYYGNFSLRFAAILLFLSTSMYLFIPVHAFIKKFK